MSGRDADPAQPPGDMCGFPNKAGRSLPSIWAKYIANQ